LPSPKSSARKSYIDRANRMEISCEDQTACIVIGLKLCSMHLSHNITSYIETGLAQMPGSRMIAYMCQQVLQSRSHNLAEWMTFPCKNIICQKQRSPSLLPRRGRKHGGLSQTTHQGEYLNLALELLDPGSARAFSIAFGISHTPQHQMLFVGKLSGNRQWLSFSAV